MDRDRDSSAVSQLRSHPGGRAGPHEFSNPEVRRLTGRDFAGQAEVLPGGERGLAAAKG